MSCTASVHIDSLMSMPVTPRPRRMTADRVCRPARGSSSLLVAGGEKDDVAVAQPSRVGLDGDAGDLVVADGEREDGLRQAAVRVDSRRNAVDQREPGGL